MKNHADALIFHTAICFRVKTNSFDGRREIAFANFSSPPRDKSLGNEDYDERKACAVKCRLHHVPYETPDEGVREGKG